MSEIKKRPLGKSGIRVAPLALGGNVFGWTADEATSFRLLDAFVAAGFDALDTADVYFKWGSGNRGGGGATNIRKGAESAEERARGDHPKQNWAGKGTQKKRSFKG